MGVANFFKGSKTLHKAVKTTEGYLPIDIAKKGKNMTHRQVEELLKEYGDSK